MQAKATGCKRNWDYPAFNSILLSIMIQVDPASFKNHTVLDVNKSMKTDDSHTNVSSVYICWVRGSHYICSSSLWAQWTSSPHGKGNTQESAQWEFRKVNKWVWNASVSHAAYLDTAALKKHVSGLKVANWNSMWSAGKSLDFDIKFYLKQCQSRCSLYRNKRACATFHKLKLHEICKWCLICEIFAGPLQICCIQFS